MLKFRKNERGDTMIEVMFAMAIISVVLAAAYATSSKNLQTSQLSKERTIATNIAEAQLEQLKALKAVPSDDVFCIDLSDTSSYVTATDEANPSTECVDGFYEKSITKDSNDSTFTIKVQWIPPGGSVDNKSIVQLQYRDYDFSTLGSSTVTAELASSTGSSATINVAINNQTNVGQRGIVYGTTRNLAIDTTGFTTKRSSSTDSSFTITTDPITSDTRYYLRAFIQLSDGSYKFSNVIEVNSGPATVAILGDAHSSCVPVSPSYPCNNVGSGVYSNVDFKADYPFNIPANSGYNAIVIDYSDNAGYPNPPADWYNYSLNIYINGSLSVSNYLIGASSGRALIPFNNSVALSSIGIEWTNNYWVSTNTLYTAYDPDFWIKSVGVASVDTQEITKIKPAVTTGTFSSVTRSSATVTGTIVSEGDSSVTERGVVYGPYINPSIGNYVAVSSENSNSYSTSLTKLKPNTTYYARAYAKNASGYAYAPTYTSFTTQAVGAGYVYGGSHGTSQYYISTGTTDWRTAKSRSESIGGHLVTLNSSGENTAVSTLPALGGVQAWIGFTDEAVEGQWKWVTGETSTFTAWAPGEPNDGSANGVSYGTQDYALLNWTSGNKWDDQWHAQSSLKFVVEFD